MQLEPELHRRLEAGRLRIPPYPAVALRLRQVAADPHASTKKLTDVIAADAALVGAVLAQANSPAYGACGYVIGIDSAIARIGLDAVSRLSVALALAAASETPGPLRALRRDAWRRSLLAGKVASVLALARSLDREEVFVAGLLQGFGAVAVLAALEDLGVSDSEAAMPVVERLRVPFGCAIAARWKLPAPILRVMEHCHDAAYVGPDREVVRVVATALVVIEALDRAASVRDIEGLTARDADRITKSLGEITELMNLFEPRVEPARAVRPVAPRREESSWRIDIAATAKGMSLRARAMTPDLLLMVAPQPLPQNWLVPLVLHSDPPVDMLANVLDCRARPDGTHELVVRPFGLDGPHRDAWRLLVSRIRP